MIAVRAAAVAAAALTLTGCPSGYQFRYTPGLAHAQHANVIRDLAEGARKGCAEALMPLVHCEQSPRLCRRDPETDVELAPAKYAALRPLMTFVHMSDAQLKEDQVDLDGPLGERLYDGVTSGAGRNGELEQFDFASLLASILSINAVRNRAPGAAAPGPAPPSSCAEPAAPRAPVAVPGVLPPSFAVHTGDAIDAGMFSELFEFLAVMSELDVPFYNVVGNHDDLFFGTFPKQAMKGMDVTLPFVPVGDLDRFLLAHRRGATRYDPSIPFDSLEDPPREAVVPVVPPGSPRPPAPRFKTSASGFDLFCPMPAELSPRDAAHLDAESGVGPSSRFPRRDGGLCTEARGYYGQDFPLPPGADGRARKVRLLVLNTAEVGPKSLKEALDMRSTGKLREEQYLWLGRELGSHREASTLFLVAGHHPVGSFVEEQEERLQRLLVGEPRVAAYLTGHTHVWNLRSYARPSGPPLWQVTAGSLLVYPQMAAFADLLEDSSGEVYLRVRSFRQRLGDAFCGASCPLRALAARGRRGALDDRTDQDWRDESWSKLHANGLLRVAGFRAAAVK